MNNYFNRLLPIFVMTLLCIYSCQDDHHFEEEDIKGDYTNLKTSNCIGPDTIGIIHYTPSTNSLGTYDITYEWTSNASEYSFEFLIDGVRQVLPYTLPSGTGTLYDTIIPLFTNSYNVNDTIPIGSSIEARVKSVCNTSSDTIHSDPTTIIKGHGNGGATVDDVGLAPENWVQIFNSSCDYLRFTTNTITNMNGQYLLLTINDPWQDFYKRSELFDFSTIDFSQELDREQINTFLQQIANGINNSEITSYELNDFSRCDPYSTNRTGCTVAYPFEDMDDINCAFMLNAFNWSNDTAYPFDNTNATGDMDAASCLNNSSPKRNVWFSFESPASKEIEFFIHPVGNFRNYVLTIWEWDDDNNEIIETGEFYEMSNDPNTNEAWSSGCYYSYYNHDGSIAAAGLDTSKVYFISVDNISNFKGQFNITINDAISNDYAQGAIDLTTTTSSDVFTTTDKTPDLKGVSCYSNNLAKRNVWFEIKGSDYSEIEIEILPIGLFRYYYTTLWEWDDDGDGFIEENEIIELSTNDPWFSGCQFIYSNTSTKLTAKGLDSSTKYLMSVDNHGPHMGEFNLSINNSITQDYVFGAFNLSDAIQNNTNWCSGATEFFTTGQTPDETDSSCNGTHTPKRNIWFKFDLSVDSDISLDIDPSGTFRYYNMKLWKWIDSDNDGEVSYGELSAVDTSIYPDACQYTVNTASGNVSAEGLTAGSYYLSVDNVNNYHGSFQLCYNRTDAD